MYVSSLCFSVCVDTDGLVNLPQGEEPRKSSARGGPMYSVLFLERVPTISLSMLLSCLICACDGWSADRK